MQKEELMLQKRLIELPRTAYRRGIICYSDFLNLNELNILHTTPHNEFDTMYCSSGGYMYSERQMVAFLPDAFSLYPVEEIDFPYETIAIVPLQKKFAEEFSHRDVLGAVLHLGLERGKLGDILVEQDRAILFAHRSIAQYICDNLTRIRHTTVLAQRILKEEFHYEPKLESIRGTVASVRLDSLLALAFSASRSKLTGQIESGKVFVNGKLITSNGYQVKEGDIISVRGLGRFRFCEASGKTKKGRISVCINKYI